MMIRIQLLFLSIFSLVCPVVFGQSTENPNIISHSELMRVITGLLLVLLIIILLSWIVKRLQGTNLSSSTGFQSIASMTLGPKEKVILLKVGERHLLMGVGGGSISLLYDFGEHMPKGFDLENKKSFADLLKSSLGKS